MVTLNPINTRPSAEELSKFGTLLLLGLPIAGLVWSGIFYWKLEVFNPWIIAGFACVGIFVWVLTRLFASGARVVYVGWHALASAIDWVISLIALSIMYFIVLVPMALVMRAFGRKPLPVVWSKESDSYWQSRTSKPELKRYFRQY